MKGTSTRFRYIGTLFLVGELRAAVPVTEHRVLTESIIPVEGSSIGFCRGLLFFIPNKFYNRQGGRANAAPFFDSDIRGGELGTGLFRPPVAQFEANSGLI